MFSAKIKPNYRENNRRINGFNSNIKNYH